MKIKAYFLFLFVAAVCCGNLKAPEQTQATETGDPNVVVQPGNGIASGVSKVRGDMPLRFSMSDDGKRLIVGAGQRTPFYDINHIKRVDITFSQSDWWNQLTANYSSRTDIPARMTYDGQELRYDVGVRFRGSTSYNRNRSEKKPFGISVDFERGNQNVGGYNNLNFNPAYNDNSFLREAIYGAVNERYMPAISINYIDLYINGASWGIYVNTQQIDNDFINEWFLSRRGSRWRAEASGGGGGGMRPGGMPPAMPNGTLPPDAMNRGRQRQMPGGRGMGGGGFGRGGSALNYMGDEGANYEPFYTLRRTYREDPWQDLANTIRVLNQTPLSELETSIREVLDLDRTLWYLACEVIFADEDGYINKGGTDYFLYWDVATGRLTPIEYDGNEILNSSRVSWSPFVNESNTNLPLMNRLLAVPEIRQRYLAHFRTILKESFNPEAMNEMIDRYASMIDEHINNDPKKMMSYAQFTNGVSNLKDIIRRRYEFLMSNSEVNVKGLDISDVQWSVNGSAWAQPSQNDRVQVTAKVNGEAGVGSVYIHAGTGLAGNFSKIEMTYDRNAGVYSAYIPAQNQGTRVRFYVEAIASDSAKTKTFEPARAENDVYTYVVN